MVTFLVAEECVAAGRVQWTDRVIVSAAADAVGGTTANIKAGEEYTVRDTASLWL
jgi:D-alanyl-D-alanine carboxypeptidase